LKNNENIKEQLEKLGKRSIQKSMFWCVQNNFDYDEKVIECINESI
jgi:putative IMPACT (imprinted ancient) family translation regulator